LVASIERDLYVNKPQVAMDRLHTYCMKKFAHLLQQRGEDVSTKDTLNSRTGRYFNPLRRTKSLRPITEKIMVNTVETFELFNIVRNTASLAHDNELVEVAEARFIFDSILRVCPKSLGGIAEFSKHEADGSELEEGKGVAVEVLPVLG